jgi:hypothetical protein
MEYTLMALKDWVDYNEKTINYNGFVQQGTSECNPIIR